MGKKGKRKLLCCPLRYQKYSINTIEKDLLGTGRYIASVHRGRIVALGMKVQTKALSMGECGSRNFLIIQSNDDSSLSPGQQNQ